MLKLRTDIDLVCRSPSLPNIRRLQNLRLILNRRIKDKVLTQQPGGPALLNGPRCPWKLHRYQPNVLEIQ